MKLIIKIILLITIFFLLTACSSKNNVMLPTKYNCFAETCHQYEDGMISVGQLSEDETLVQNRIGPYPFKKFSDAMAYKPDCSALCKENGYNLYDFDLQMAISKLTGEKAHLFYCLCSKIDSKEITLITK